LTPSRTRSGSTIPASQRQALDELAAFSSSARARETSVWAATPTSHRAKDVGIHHTQPTYGQSGRPVRVATKPTTSALAVHEPRNLPAPPRPAPRAAGQLARPG
jgi:hypothetical protein